MKKFFAINGSPRRNGNTAQLLNEAVRGAADAVVFGAPIYFMNLSAGMVAFIERFFFSNYIYSAEIPTVFPKKLPSAWFYTMNMTEDRFAQFNMAAKLGVSEMTTKNILQVAPKILRAYNTVQFKDYSKYESSIFNPEEKIAYRAENFANLCAQAYEIGRSLIAES